MPPRRKSTPSNVVHKQSGRGRPSWTDAAGTRQQRLRPGRFGSRESLEAKARLELELAISPTATIANRNAISLAELLCAYLEHAQPHYRGPMGGRRRNWGV